MRKKAIKVPLDNDLTCPFEGKEWTTSDGEVLNTHPMYIKKISMKGEVTHIDWHDQYVAVRKAAGVTSSVGYMIHEVLSRNI